MANVLFKRGNQANVPLTTGAVEGAFYLTKDTHRLYYGNASGGCDLLSQAIVEVANIQALSNQPASDGQFYYVKDSNILAVYVTKNGQGQYVQINPDTKLIQTDTQFAAVDSNGTTNVTLTLNQSRADAATVAAVTADFDVIGAGSVSVSGSGNDITITGALLNVSEYTEDVSGTSTHKGATIGLGSSAANLREGNNISISSSGSNITIAATDNYVTGGTMEFEPVSTSATPVNTGFKVAASLTRSGSLGPVSVAAASIDPVIAYGHSNDDIAVVSTSSTAKFSGGTATLDVYTAAQTKTLIEDQLKAINAMTYKGTVADAAGAGDVQALPTTGVHIGDVWLASGEVTYNNTKYPAGTMFVANGTEVDGVISGATLGWSAVQTSDRDTHYHGEGSNGTGWGKLDIINETTSSSVGFVKVLEGDDNDSISVTGTPNISTNSVDIEVAHKDFAGTNTPATQARQSVGTDATVTYVSGLTLDNGHVAGYTTTTATIGNDYTHVSEVEVTATNATVTGGSGATLTTSVTTSNAAETLNHAETGSATIESTSLAISGANSAVTINLVWQEF